MTKKQLMALMQIIKGVNTLRSTYTDRLFVQTDIRNDDDLLNRLVIDAPFTTDAWALSLLIEDNSIIRCKIEDTRITFE